MTKSSRRRGESKTKETQQYETVAVDAAPVQLFEDGHVPKKDKASRELPKSDNGSTFDDDGRATRKLKKEKCAHSEHVEIKDKNAKKKKLKPEVFNAGRVDLHRNEADNSESAKESDKRAKRRKQKAQLRNSEDLQVENDCFEHGEDATLDGKSKKKKRKRAKLENGGASDQSSPKRKTEHVEIEDRNVERKKLKAEVFSEGPVDLHRGDTDNPESAEEPDKRAKRRKQKAEVESSDYLRVGNGSSECAEDAAPDRKRVKKKWKKTGLENDGASDQLLPKKKAEHVEIGNRNAGRKKLKAEVFNEGSVDLHRGNTDNPESAEEPDKRKKRRKQKAEVENFEYLQVENDSSERIEDAAPDGKTIKKKRKKTGLENDNASDHSSPKKTVEAEPSDQGESKVAKVKKAKKKKKNRKAPPVATKNTKDQCLQYLKDWQGPSWKFCKNKQLWLLSHAFEENMIPENDFEILLRYIEGLKGGARERLQQSANKFLEKANQGDNEDEDIDAGKYERARLVLQMLD